MKRAILSWVRLVLVGSVVLPGARAEYPELTELRQSSFKAIQRHSTVLSNVDPKFDGVIRFGRSLETIKDGSSIPVEELTDHSPHYWRAVLEMAHPDPSVLFAHAHLYIARGEPDRGEIYFLLGSLTMDSEFEGELKTYESLRSRLNRVVEKDMKTGIAYHDKGMLEKAIKSYDTVLEAYPASAWACYEKGFSYLMMSGDKDENEKKQARMNAQCRKRDPFYWLAYQGSDREVLRKMQVLVLKVNPFLKEGKRDVQGMKDFAVGCEEMDLYPVAAHARWILVFADPDNSKKHIGRFLDLIEKSGCKETEFLRSQFNVD